jgi:hypothetical protein
MAHLVAHAVGAPAERQLRQIAGSNDEAAIVIGQPEEVIGAQARLHIFESDIVNRFALGEGVAHIRQHLASCGLDVDLLADDAQRLHQRPSVALGALPGRETGHRVAEDGRARDLEIIATLAATISAWVESSPPETPITRCLPEVAWKRRARPCTWMLNAS